ncbi:hypothetical protein [Burkholderia sp. Bp9031]|uniref:hypothetical protein n=1 Tax=Burkholderia sp. Bp9031 TaxID=2184566 RepID=UPI00139601B8|nr:MULTISPECIES: hypothetical protein [Burkholderia]
MGAKHSSCLAGAQRRAPISGRKSILRLRHACQGIATGVPASTRIAMHIDATPRKKPGRISVRPGQKTPSLGTRMVRGKYKTRRAITKHGYSTNGEILQLMLNKKYLRGTSPLAIQVPDRHE